CQASGNRRFINCSACPPCSKSTASTNNGKSKGMGTLHKVAKIAKRLAVIKLRLCCTAKRRTYPQLMRSVTRINRDPAIKKGFYACVSLITIGDHRIVLLMYSQQGRKPSH